MPIRIMREATEDLFRPAPLPTDTGTGPIIDIQPAPIALLTESKQS